MDSVYTERLLSGVRPDGRLTFLLCGKKVSKEAHPLSRPCGVPSLRANHAAGLELAALGQPSRTTPHDFPCARRARRGRRMPLAFAPLPSPLPPGERETTERSIARWFAPIARPGETGHSRCCSNNA